MNDAKEEIKARLAVEDVVGQYIELKRTGRNLKGRSPWGVDKTPSFMVSPERGIWHDFSANKGGDIFSFVMEIEGIGFREALEKLATQAGVKLERYHGGDKKVAERKRRVRACLELACRFYQACLARNRGVCEYVFYKRNMNRKTVEEFKIGYAPRTKNALVNFLEKNGFSKEEREEAGLVNRFGGDLFMGRMMVPFMDTTGNVIGFTGRILDKGEPKYLNTPETLLFNKSGFVFGLTQAKEAIRRSGFVVIVEGNMDVISSHQSGVKEAVATSGTAMTELHLKKLAKLTDDIRLAYDQDEAGVKATERAIMLAGDLGVKLSVIGDYDGAKDPDELIQRAPEKWQKAVQKNQPAIEWLLLEYEKKVDLTTGVGKREYSDLAVKLIDYVNDPVEKRHYEQLVAKKLAVKVEDLWAKKVRKGRKMLKMVKKCEKGQCSTDELRIRQLEEVIWAITLFGGVEAKEMDMEVPTEEAKLAELELIFEEKYGDWKKEDLQAELEGTIKRREKEMKQWKRKKLQAELAKVKDDEVKMMEILAKLEALQK